MVLKSSCGSIPNRNQNEANYCLPSRSSLTPSPPSSLFPQSSAVSHFWSFISHPLSPWLISSLPPLLYSINLSIRLVDYIRDYRLKGIPFHLSPSLLALLLSLSLYRSSTLTHPSSSVSLIHIYLYTHKCSGISCFSFSLVSPDLTYHLLLLLPPYQPASFRPRPLLSQLLLLCLSTLYLSLLQSPRLLPASLSFNSFSDILPARCLFLSPPPSMIIIGTMMQMHESESWLFRMTNLIEKETDLSSS